MRFIGLINDRIQEGDSDVLPGYSRAPEREKKWGCFLSMTSRSSHCNASGKYVHTPRPPPTTPPFLPQPFWIFQDVNSLVLACCWCLNWHSDAVIAERECCWGFCGSPCAWKKRIKERKGKERESDLPSFPARMRGRASAAVTRACLSHASVRRLSLLRQFHLGVGGPRIPPPSSPASWIWETYATWEADHRRSDVKGQRLRSRAQHATGDALVAQCAVVRPCRRSARLQKRGRKKTAKINREKKTPRVPAVYKWMPLNPVWHLKLQERDHGKMQPNDVSPSTMVCR